MAAVEEQVVWRGAEALRPFLVPVSSLEPFPGNPRRGDVDAVRASLRRFGQVRPLLADGSRVVAGHHVRLAAEAEGWTHVAAIPNEFSDPEEARAYLLADNRTHDRGDGYDTELLVEHLRQLAEIDGLDGTGYTFDDLDDQLAQLRQLQARTDAAASPPLRDPLPEHELKEVVLLYSDEQRKQFEVWVKIIANENGTAGVSETVYAAVEIAERALRAG